MLEYYEGILFLTTNRVDNIDTAFQSRIHISLEYGDLSISSRRHVWSNFLAASSKAHSFSDHDLDELAAHAMNGREIKNVLKTAKLLARKREMEMGIEHVKTVLAIENKYVKRHDV
jgi:SpoVK/Ycf46/Vps4 family AAA+-type ATPase